MARAILFGFLCFLCFPLLGLYFAGELSLAAWHQAKARRLGQAFYDPIPGPR